jgi:hypothetical protein
MDLSLSNSRSTLLLKSTILPAKACYPPITLRALMLTICTMTDGLHSYALKCQTVGNLNNVANGYIYIYICICKRQIAFRAYFFIDTMPNLSNAGLAVEIPQGIHCYSEELNTSTLCQNIECLVTSQIRFQKQIQELLCNGYLLDNIL